MEKSNLLQHSFCNLCAHKTYCETRCHGTHFRISETRLGLNAQSYIPKNLEESFYDAQKIFGSTAKHLVPLDAYKIDLPVLVLTYAGKGKRQTLQAIEVWKGDTGQVGKVFGDIYLKECITNPSLKPYPLRFKRQGNKVYLIQL